MSGLPTAVALGAYAVGVYAYGGLPRQTAYLVCAAAGAHVVLIVSVMATGGFFSLQGSVIAVIPAFLFAWILDTAVVMIRIREPERALS